jgi:hypothetical protein
MISNLISQYLRYSVRQGWEKLDNNLLPVPVDGEESRAAYKAWNDIVVVFWLKPGKYIHVTLYQKNAPKITDMACMDIIEDFFGGGMTFREVAVPNRLQRLGVGRGARYFRHDLTTVNSNRSRSWYDDGDY